VAPELPAVKEHAVVDPRLRDTAVQGHPHHVARHPAEDPAGDQRPDRDLLAPGEDGERHEGDAAEQRQHGGQRRQEHEGRAAEQRVVREQLRRPLDPVDQEPLQRGGGGEQEDEQQRGEEGSEVGARPRGRLAERLASPPGVRTDRVRLGLPKGSPHGL